MERKHLFVLRLAVLMVAVIICISLWACGNGGKTGGKNQNDNTVLFPEGYEYEYDEIVQQLISIQLEKPYKVS